MHRLLIDTDPGEDDALAIMMAAAHPNAKIEAIFSVAGNVGVDKTTNNAGVILDQLGLDIPIYAGCADRFVLASIDASYAHGDDGLGNTGMVSDRPVEPTHAAIELINRVTAEPNELTLVTLGPFTNVATALKLEPNLPSLIKRVVAMAGAVTAQGNINVTAEFNVFADPEAARVVFDAWGAAGKTIEVADWELTMRNGFAPNVRAQWEALQTSKSRFFAAISAHSNQFIEAERNRTINYFADPVAMAIALEPDIVQTSLRRNLTVELSSGQVRGQTVVDWQGQNDRPVNAEIVMEIDNPRLHQLVLNAQR